MPWTDPYFRPELRSLFDTAIDERKPAFEKFVWKRASEIYDAPRVFVDGVDPNDVNQG